MPGYEFFCPGCAGPGYIRATGLICSVARVSVQFLSKLFSPLAVHARFPANPRHRDVPAVNTWYRSRRTGFSGLPVDSWELLTCTGLEVSPCFVLRAQAIVAASVSFYRFWKDN